MALVFDFESGLKVYFFLRIHFAFSRQLQNKTCDLFHYHLVSWLSQALLIVKVIKLEKI
jgi:hypothetical protein